MTSWLATLVFYLALVAAWLLLRGTFAGLPRALEMSLAFAVSLIGFAVWTMGWRSPHPRGRTKSGRATLNWAQLALASLLGTFLLALFIGPLPWAAQKITTLRGSDGDPGDQIHQHSSPSSHPAPAANESAERKNATSESPERDRVAAAPQNSHFSAVTSFFKTTPRRRLLLWIVALVAAVLLVLIWLWLRSASARAHQQTSLSRNPAPRPLPGYHRELLKLCRRLGVSPEPGKTLRELIGELRTLGCHAESLEPVALYHYAVFYENVPPQPHAEKNLQRSLRKLRRRKLIAARP